MHFNQTWDNHGTFMGTPLKYGFLYKNIFYERHLAFPINITLTRLLGQAAGVWVSSVP